MDVTVAPELSVNAGETDKRFRVLKLGAAGSAMSFAPTRVVKRDQSYAWAAWLGGRVCANPHGSGGPDAPGMAAVAERDRISRWPARWAERSLLPSPVFPAYRTGRQWRAESRRPDQLASKGV